VGGVERDGKAVFAMVKGVYRIGWEGWVRRCASWSWVCVGWAGKGG
jgi:hypothetical protein